MAVYTVTRYDMTKGPEIFKSLDAAIECAEARTETFRDYNGEKVLYVVRDMSDGRILR